MPSLNGSRRINISARNLWEFYNIHPTLKLVLADIINNWLTATLFITSFNRTNEEDISMEASGIHSSGPPWRAIDIRILDLDPDPIKCQQLADTICEKVNKSWTYDPSRPTLLVAFCKPHGTGPHVHLQVCYSTIGK